jgi:hypothetical protein
MWRGHNQDHAAVGAEAGAGAAEEQDSNTNGECNRRRGKEKRSSERHDESLPFLVVGTPTNTTNTITTTDTPPSPVTLHTRRRLHRLCMNMLLMLMLFLIILLTVASTTGAFVDQRLPQLPLLPANPRRAYATLHTDSNACYDMALLVFLASWSNVTRSISSTGSTTTSSSQQQQQQKEQSQPPYPLLVLYSTPTLPRKVAAYIEQNTDIIYAIAVQERYSYVVQNPRWRKCGTKLAVWDRDSIGNFDQVAYFDSDHIFHSSGKKGGEKVGSGADAMFEAGDGENAALLYAKPDRKKSSQFNAGRMLLRPDNAIYQKLVYLYNHRFWIMDWTDMIKSGDQRFLNAVFSKQWQRMDSTATPEATATTTSPGVAASKGPSAGSASSRMEAQHAKVWKLATFPSSTKSNAQRHNATQSMARKWINTLGLHDELKECMQWRFAYGNYKKEKGLVEYWF